MQERERGGTGEQGRGGRWLGSATLSSSVTENAMIYGREIESRHEASYNLHRERKKDRERRKETERVIKRERRRE